ncbi:MAG: septal ring lytic transglycosylase RlpA family protein [Cellvibrionaceae bacterium]
MTKIAESRYLRLRSLSLALGLVMITACSSQVAVVKDSGPKQAVDVSHIPDAVPRHETRTRAGNKSRYTVLGKTYEVLPHSRDFVETGIASWYGNKFHGRKTANGEIYSMYGMTAAHKNLPIPSYVRVTNLNNGKQVVVRVNDRGPFHEGRVIDLTYAAASKLGFVKQGTAPVRVETVGPGDQSGAGVQAAAVPQTSALQSSGGRGLGSSGGSQGAMPKAPAPENSAGYQLPSNTFLQVGAFSAQASAETLRARIDGLTQLPVSLIQPQTDALYRVRVGPIRNNLVLMNLRETLLQHQISSPHIVYD